VSLGLESAWSVQRMPGQMSEYGDCPVVGTNVFIQRMITKTVMRKYDMNIEINISQLGYRFFVLINCRAEILE
jgi:hypothetical protein